MYCFTVRDVVIAMRGNLPSGIVRWDVTSAYDRANSSTPAVAFFVAEENSRLHLFAKIQRVLRFGEFVVRTR